MTPEQSATTSSGESSPLISARAGHSTLKEHVTLITHWLWQNPGVTEPLQESEADADGLPRLAADEIPSEISKLSANMQCSWVVPEYTGQI